MHGRRGFGLVEVMVSILLLSIVVAGAYGLITSAARLNRTSRSHYLAANMAKNRLENARNYRYEELPLLREDRVVVNDQGAPDTMGFFRRSTLVNTNYGYKLTEITIAVEMKSTKTGQFAGEEERVSSLFTDYSESQK